MTPLRKNPFVVVHWRDAVGDRHDEIPPPHCLSGGWLVEKNKSYVRIAGEIIEDGSYCEITTIPRGMVVGIEEFLVTYPEVFQKIRRLSNTAP